ncbi:MAG: DUF350 domain-containing protein [Planctomycetaceae bacterium]
MIELVSTVEGLFAADAESGGTMAALLQHLIAAVVFAAVGIAVFAVGFKVVARILPFSLRKELEEDHNTAVAIIAGSMLIGISIIIAAAILG